MALVAGHYLNQIFVVQRGDYADLGPLLLTVALAGLVLPNAAIAAFGRRSDRHMTRRRRGHGLARMRYGADKGRKRTSAHSSSPVRLPAGASRSRRPRSIPTRNPIASARAKAEQQRIGQFAFHRRHSADKAELQLTCINQMTDGRL